MIVRGGAVRGTGEPDWAARRRRIPGAPSDVVLYLVNLSSVADWAGRASECLSDAERARALSLHDPVRREEYLASRVVLRHVLARAVGSPPLAVDLSTDPATGAPDPVVASSAGVSHTLLYHSLARTPGYVAVVTARRPVGVDLELRQSPDQADALLRLFHPADQARLRSLPVRRRTRAVTDAWVRLEALQKARGVGLSVDPSRVPVGTPDGERHPDGLVVTRVPTRWGSPRHAAAAWRGDPLPEARSS